MTRRMFSSDIVASDAFLDMPTSTRELYFQLGMYADDDGFVNPKKIMRMISASPDDLKVLITKRFILSFESGVVVIKHWLIHNLIRGDRYKETMYLDEKKSLQIKDNKAYTELTTNGIPNGNQMATQVKLSKVKLIDNTETKVSNKKTMKNSFKYNENKHTDAFEDVVDYETNEIPKKAQKINAPFDLEKELEKMEQEENSYQDIVAIFIREKKLPIENISQLRVVQYRHTKDAKILSGAYTNEQIFKAIDEIKKELKDVDWTLGTVLKILTK